MSAPGDANGSLATTILIIGAGAGTFASFCPSWFTVRSPFFHEQNARAGNIAAIRQGEVAGAVVTIGTGVAAASLTGSVLPLFGALVISGIMVAGYEYSIRNPASAHETDESSRMRVFRTVR